MPFDAPLQRWLRQLSAALTPELQTELGAPDAERLHTIASALLRATLSAA